MKALLSLTACLICLARSVAAQDVVIIGEIHDNPAHHAEQAARVAAIAPAALVFEMLTPEQAAAITPANRAAENTLRAALGWDDTGWPDFSMYFPIFAAAPQARIFGAGVTRETARVAMEQGFDTLIGQEDTARFSLDAPPPPDQQAAREALQMRAHCDALPETLLPGMVRVQRLRDAMLVRAAITAHDATGGPVVVITGNGHARRDWGVPALLARAAPGLDVIAIGQAEDGHPLPGSFDEVISAPAPARDDPCEAFN
ncbi:ChaN family lipoprotein [Roseovarius amoyensis]|uniref:ChaN family lipoprotein n=1 Tax=Roseovarius amoyensis TaxID=2211448 RepID=UPI000DBE5FE9|nr:ChaN family lipoprotein [Roseovarius amoyensis]